jgi:hypothetical protein
LLFENLASSTHWHTEKLVKEEEEEEEEEEVQSWVLEHKLTRIGDPLSQLNVHVFFFFFFFFNW